MERLSVEAADPVSNSGIQTGQRHVSSASPPLPDVPVIDMQRLWSEATRTDATKDREAVAGGRGKRDFHPTGCDGSEFSKFRFACRELGFMQLVNHGIPREDLRAILGAAEDFLSLPVVEKMKLKITVAEECLIRNRGYFCSESGNLDQFQLEKDFSGDVKEGIDFGLESIRIGDSHSSTTHQEGSSCSTSKWHVGNQWPAQTALPSFRLTVKAYLERAVVLAKQVTRLFARVLGINEEELLQKFNCPAVNLRLLHYPPPPVSPDDEQKTTFLSSASSPDGAVTSRDDGVADLVVAGAHTDYGCCTLLLQDEIGGLQVRFKDAWVDVLPIRDALVFNIGDMLCVWTRGAFKSTLHRVIRRRPPPLGGSPLPMPHRYSAPFFWNPSPDVTITPLILEQMNGVEEIDWRLDRREKVDGYAEDTERKTSNPYQVCVPIGKTVDDYLTHRYVRAFARASKA